MIEVPKRTLHQLMDLGLVRYSRLRHRYYHVETRTEIRPFTVAPPSLNRAQRRSL